MKEESWLKENWRWIVFGLLAACALWFMNQYVAAIGSAFAAVWRWLWHKGKEVVAQRKINREEGKRIDARNKMIRDVRKAAAQAADDDSDLDKEAAARGQASGDPNLDKEKTLKMLDQLDDMDRKGSEPG